MGKGRKVKAAGRKTVKDLGVKDGAKAVAGGRKAGGTQQEYLVYKLNDAFISGVSISGSGA